MPPSTIFQRKGNSKQQRMGGWFSSTIAWNWGLWKPTLTFCIANYYAALLSNHNMKWGRKVHKIGLLRRFMRIAWTLNSSTRRYLRSFSPPWPVLHHLQPYDGTLWVSLSFKLDKVGLCAITCKYLGSAHILFTWLWESWSSRMAAIILSISKSIYCHWIQMLMLSVFSHSPLLLVAGRLKNILSFSRLQ